MFNKEKKGVYVMGDKIYSENIAEMIKSIITGNGWEYDFDEYKGLFTFVMDVEGRSDKVDYLISVYEERRWNR